MPSRQATRIAVLCFCLALVPAVARAQYPYGKNKVVYDSQKWKILKTQNVEIYYYPNEENLLAFAAPIAEETFRELSEYMDLELDHPLTLVFYSSQYEFQQTNIIPYLI